MYDHIFYKQAQISRSDIRPHIKWAFSLVILHMVISIFLQGLCGYIWVNILTLSPQRGTLKRNLANLELPLSFNNATLETVVKHKHLGVELITNLSWKDHIMTISENTGKKLNVLEEVHLSGRSTLS